MTGAELREIRLSLRLNQTEAAALIFKSKRTFSRYENELSKIPESVVRKFIKLSRFDYDG